MIITVSRQYGAGGAAVAKLVADGLGWTLIDNDAVDLVAQRAGIALQEADARILKGRRRLDVD